MNIHLTQTTVKNGVTQRVENKVISENEYKLLTDKETLKFFRRLGGKETIRQGYTLNGYCTTYLSSISPDKKIKIIREFNFKN